MRSAPLLLATLTLALALGNATAHAGTVVQFRTALGDVDVELYDAEKPITTSNFLAYVTTGRFQDTFFHRLQPNFVVQGGAARTANRGRTNEALALIPTFPAITNEFGVGPFLSNTAGTIAMAKTANPNSATSQFFFNLANNSASLDRTNNSGGFTVFGRVIRGTNAFARWNSFFVPSSQAQLATGTNMVVNAGSFQGLPINELPIYKLRPNGSGGLYIDTEDLMYVDISLLNVRVQNLDNGSARIQWNPVAGRTNYVEYTDAFPPDWQPLTHLAPDQIPARVLEGPDLPADSAPKSYPATVVDPAATPQRFYRVRATF